MSAWKLPLIVAALVLPIVAGFMAAGPALGVAVGAFAVLALLVVAARMRPRGPIGEPPREDARRRVLLVATCPVEDPAAVRRVAADARLRDGTEPAQVRVLAPASIGFLDRWASDVEDARRDAQECLVATVAALAKAGVEAEARVGDEDVVQAVEDQLGSYPATEVVLVSDGKGDAPAAAAAELRDRLRPEFREVHVSG
jgi:hypothetical protein